VTACSALIEALVDIASSSQQIQMSSEALRLPTARSLQWGHVEEYKAATDTDSVSSSRLSEGGDSNAESAEGGDDDGWGWFSNEEDEAQADQADAASSSATPQVASSVKHVSRPGTAAAAASTSSSAKSAALVEGETAKKPRALVRPVSQTRLEPVQQSNSSSASASSSKTGHSAGGGASLLLLGSEQWPTKTPKAVKPVRVRDSFLSSLLSEARAKNVSLVSSSVIILGRGLAIGFALRSIPMLFFSKSLITRDAIRTGLFVGLSMSAYHVMAMSEHYDTHSRHYIGVAGILTPFLILLPREARSSIAWFMTTRLIESMVHGGLKALPRTILENVPFSKWIFALGNAQVIYSWLFHRDAMPKPLVDLIDSVSSLRSVDIAQSLVDNGDPRRVQSAVYPNARMSIGFARDFFPAIFRSAASLLGLVVSDVFSAASLLGPLFWKSPLAVAELSFVLGADVAFSRFAVVALSRILGRTSPTDAWAGGLFAGLAAVQFEPSETIRIELGL